MRDYFRNRQVLGSIRQLDVVVPTYVCTKNLDFNSSSDLTDNFTQILGSGATQTVEDSVVKFRNANYDKENSIETKFALKFLDDLTMRISLTASDTKHWFPVFTFRVVDQAGTEVTSLQLVNCFSYTYSESSWQYWNSGYLYWRLGTDANNSTAATSRRISSAISSGYHIWKIIDNKNGTFNLEIDGTTVASNLSLGNENYRLGGSVNINPLNGWFNNRKYADLDYFYLTYT